MFFFKRYRYKSPTPRPRWLQILFWLFVAYVLMVAFRGERVPDEEASITPKDEAVQGKLDAYPAIQEFTSINRWRRFANPSLGFELDYQDVEAGSGDGAACGQRTTFEVRALDEASQAQVPVDQPMTLLLDGAEDTPFAGAIVGMRAGGVRQVSMGPLWFDAHALDDAMRYRFEIRMQSLTPSAGDAIGFSAQQVEEGTGLPARCGDTIQLYMRLWSADNKELYRTPEDAPQELLIGAGTLGHGLDRGLVGMTAGVVRRLMIPPAYQPKGGDIPFPRNEIAIVEVIRVPYNVIENQPTIQPETDIEEPDNEPDRQPSERD